MGKHDGDEKRLRNVPRRWGAGRRHGAGLGYCNVHPRHRLIGNRRRRQLAGTRYRNFHDNQNDWTKVVLTPTNYENDHDATAGKNVRRNFQLSSDMARPPLSFNKAEIR